MKNVLIAGCGDVGTLMGLRLVAAGYRVWGLRRNPAPLPSEIRPLAADLTDVEGLTTALSELPQDLDAVAYTAAAGGISDEAYRAAYVTGPECLLESLGRRDLAPRRMLFTSSTGVYGQTSGEWVDETSQTAPQGFSGLRVLEGEDLLRASGLETVVLRLGGIYGPGRTRMLERVLTGEATLGTGDPSYSNRIHREDAADALVHLLTLDDPAPLYLGVDDEPCELNTLYRWIADRAGVPAPLPGKGPQGSRQRSNKRCRNDLLRASGYRFRYPTFRQGYEPLIVAMESGGS